VPGSQGKRSSAKRLLGLGSFTAPAWRNKKFCAASIEKAAVWF
jgi:hypothetical protein